MSIQNATLTRKGGCGITYSIVKEVLVMVGGVWLVTSMRCVGGMKGAVLIMLMVWLLRRKLLSSVVSLMTLSWLISLFSGGDLLGIKLVGGP
jgi:hypothetical protein